ncbi:MAG TPA: CHAD domain-containing protein [Vicinamibacterales bacterium]|nr:CHAD domain-containing protein [Vicinamibacterales bacterium]
MHDRSRQPALGEQATRLADDQLALALDDLHRAGSNHGDWVHDARRRIRRVRALLRLLRPRLTDEAFDEGNRRLRTLNRRLAAVETEFTALATLARLASRPDAGDARPALDAVRTALVQRAERADLSAAATRLLKRAETAVAVERARIGTWEIERQTVPVETGLEKSRRQAAAALARALDRPTPRREREWRRSTTRLWLHVRLLEPYRRGLQALRRRLDVLDGILDDAHNVTILERLLVEEGVASRRDTATALRLLRHYRSELRTRAAAEAQAALRLVRRPQARRAAPSSAVRTTAKMVSRSRRT